MKRIVILISFIMLVTGCSRFEPEEAVLEYSHTLPNYCDNNIHALEALEKNYKEYGMILEDQQRIGTWSVLYWYLLQHHFMWGNYEEAVRIGDEFVKKGDLSSAYEYIIAVYLSGGNIEDKKLENNKYKSALTADVEFVVNHILVSYESLGDDYYLFRKWTFEPEGFNTILILASRLAARELSEADQEFVLDAILHLFIENQSLDKLLEFAPNHIWDSWLKANLMLESYSKTVGNHDLLAQLKEGRRYIANQMINTSSEQRWVKCILEERGLFVCKHFF